MTMIIALLCVLVVVSGQQTKRQPTEMENGDDFELPADIFSAGITLCEVATKRKYVTHAAVSGERSCMALILHADLGTDGSFIGHLVDCTHLSLSSSLLSPRSPRGAHLHSSHSPRSAVGSLM